MSAALDEATTYRLALRATALAYVVKGWPVIPLHQVTYDVAGKKSIKPLIQWQQHPEQRVTTSEQVERWFGLTGAAQGLAVATGELLAVDLDEYKAGFEGTALPDGGWVETHTGRGGGHVYLANPDGQRNTAGAHGPGVDTRGDGGLSVAAPTRCYHADGRVTQWQTVRPVSELPRPEALPPAPAPAVRQAQRQRSAPGTATDITLEAAAYSVARARDEWLSCVRGSRHETMIRYLAVLTRYRLAQGAELSTLVGELEAAALEHPDAVAGEEFATVDAAIGWAVNQARATPWRLAAPQGLEARFAAPDPGEALGMADWDPEGDDPDALTGDDYDGEFVPQAPTVLDLGWTLPLLYAGTPEDPRCNTIFGAPGSAKTWLAQVAAVQVAESGGRVWIVDYENSKPSYVARMKALGLSRAAIGRITYTRASQEPADQVHARLAAAKSGRYGLVVLDGMNAALSSMGADENKTGEVTRWYQRYIAGIPTAVLLDHVAKNNDGMTRRTAIGSQAKEAVLSGQAWFVEKLRGFGTSGGVGVLRLTMGKDRPGGLEGRMPGGELLVDVRVDPGGEKVALSVRVAMGEAVSPEDAVFAAMHADDVPVALTQREFVEEYKIRNGGTAVRKDRVSATLTRYQNWVMEAERAPSFITDSYVTDA